MPFPVEGRWITETETKLGIRFPAGFSVAMARSNGGTVSTPVGSFELFPFFDASDRNRIRRTCGSIDRETRGARTRPGFPQTAVAIGSNDCGDLLILLPAADRPDLLQHEVFWWDHETDEVQPVAADFAELPRR